MSDIKKATGQVEVTERGDGFVKFKLGMMTLKAWAEGINACETPAEGIDTLDGKYATAEYVDVKKGNITYHNALSLKPLAPDQAEALANGAEIKDRRITRVAIMKSFIENGRLPETTPTQAFNWVWEIRDEQISG